MLVENVLYTLSVQDDVEPRIDYIATDSPEFVVPEGLAVGAIYDDLLAKAVGDVIEEPDWGFFVCLPSGWAAVFSCDEARWGLVGPEKRILKRLGGVLYCENQDLRLRTVGWFFRRRGTCGN